MTVTSGCAGSPCSAPLLAIVRLAKTAIESAVALRSTYHHATMPVILPY
jgi:hypothetical protein